MIKHYEFFRRKYGDELLIDLIHLETLEKYIIDGAAHTLSYYDITLIEEGSGNLYLDQEEFPVVRNNIYFSLPGQIRRWEINKVPTGLVLIFEEAFLCEFFNDTRFVQNLAYFNPARKSPTLTINDEEYKVLEGLMLQIEGEIKCIKENDNHILRAILYQVLIWLNRHFKNTYDPAESHVPNRHIASFADLLEKEFLNNRSVSYYANKLNITPNHLNGLANQHLGKSAKQYITDRIILEAKRLLGSSELSVSEIATRLSFEDNSYFTRLFRKATGDTPLAFRKKQNP
ncbi:MAG TPA: helix-turn-helix domain-containing protein [Bacteroidales bacterium]|nr:helix-turn-helix domain-containing protein [Bacteroidales bacterium]